MPIFCVKSVKIYTGQFFLHRYVCGVCDKYEVCADFIVYRALEDDDDNALFTDISDM